MKTNISRKMKEERSLTRVRCSACAMSTSWRAGRIEIVAAANGALSTDDQNFRRGLEQR